MSNQSVFNKAPKSAFVFYLSVVFLNAFIDLGHKIAIQNTIFKIYDGQTQVILTAIVNGLILLPFILLFSPSGFISDRFAKHKVMRYSALMAVFVTLGITFSYYQGWFWLAFGLTFLLAIQSALYSPAKYGYIRELVGDKNLAQANGVVQAVTIVGILLGTFAFSAAFELLLADKLYQNGNDILKLIAPLGWLLVILASIEWLLSLKLPERHGDNSELNFTRRDYLSGQYLKTNLASVRSHQAIWLSIVGLATFWAVSQVVLASFPAHAKEVLGHDNTLIIQGLLAASGIGIVLGASYAGRTSRNHIELGLIPVGALGIAVSLLILPLAKSEWWMALCTAGIGFFGGLFMVPLNALIQYHSPKQQLGRVLAGNNWVQNIAMLSFLLVTIAAAFIELDVRVILWLAAVVALIGSGYTVLKLPHALVRLLVAGLFKRRYKIDVLGFDKLPSEGAVLLLGNHISWIDWALVQIACPRKVHFVMQRQIYSLWFLRPIMKFFGVVPIGSGASRRALKKISELLNAKEVVCLFPEGAISRNGHLGKFHGGFEKAVEGVEQGVIVPFYLRGLWGSSFSRSSEKLRELRTASLRRDVIIAFGDSLPLCTSAPELKQKVFELSTSAWQEHTKHLDTLAVAWLKTAKRYGKKNFVADSEAEPLSYRRTLTASLAFSGQVAKLSRGQENVGMMLPASSASLIASMAALIKAKTCVNLNYTASVESVLAGIEKAEVRTVFTSRRFIAKLQDRGIDTDTMLASVTVIHLEDVKASLSKAKLLCTLLSTYLPSWLLSILYLKHRDLESPAAIIFSSGSEGSPKGIALSQRNIHANCKQISDILNTREEDVIVGCLPPFHSFGFTVTTMMPMVEGLPVVCHPDPTDVLNVAKAIARQRATILLGTATFLRLYIRNSRVSPLMLESLRVVVAGAEKLPQSIREAFQAKFNKVIFEGYGATETTPVVSCNMPDQLDTNYWQVQRGHVPGTVGMPLPGCSARIVDPETLKELPRGQDGLVMIAGTQVMLGYLKDPDKTAEVIIELDGQRWYKTGDKGNLSDDGFLTIVDRYSRFAKIGGEMVSLGAVEQTVKNIIADSQGNEPFEIAAVNLPDIKKGERIALLIAACEDEPESLKQMLISAGMHPLMLPQAIYTVEEIPKLGSGKTNYKALDKLAREVSS